MYAKNVMVSLYYIFIFIRSEPRHSVLYHILLKYHNWLNKDLVINKRSINLLINELKLLEDHPAKTAIISKLKKIRLISGTTNMDRIYQSIPPIKYIVDNLILEIEQEETEKIRIMASSVHNYPSFILGKYYCNSKDFWNEHICYYNRIFQSDFMNDWEYLFTEYYPRHE